MQNMPLRSRLGALQDVGTVWTMERSHRAARCALMAGSRRWEIRVLVDAQILLSERCRTADEAFELAERWKLRMLDRGWRQVVPSSRRLRLVG